MEDQSKTLRKAALTVLGTIIGAGVFALPELFARVGFVPASLLFWTLAIMVLATHLLYVEVILSHSKKMRLPGHAYQELGNAGRWIAAITYPLQTVGANFAYLILGGEFLGMLMRGLGIGGGILFWQLIFWFAGALVVFFGLGMVARVEAIAVWLLMVVMAVVSLVGIDQLLIEQLSYTDWSLFLMPFGVFLFALSGLSIISEVVDLTQRDRRLSTQAVTLGTLGAALLSWIFGIALAYSGPVEKNGIEGLISTLPAMWAWLIPVFGFLAIVTSYITTAQDLKATLHLDFKIRKSYAWFFVFSMPLTLLFVVSRDFLEIVSLVGAVFGGASGIIVSMTAIFLFRRKRYLKSAFVLPIVLIAVYILGIITKLLL